MKFKLDLPIDLREYEGRMPLSKRHLDILIREAQMDIARRKEFWLRGLMIAHHITERELMKHCVLETFSEWQPGECSDTWVESVRLRINWTRWMKLKRWLRRKPKGETDGQTQEEPEDSRTES